MAASGLTVAVWVMAWPRPSDPADLGPTALPKVQPRERQPDPWPVSKIEPLLAAAGAAQEPAERLEAARRLSRVPAAQIQDALERELLNHDGRLSFAAMSLLVRWGRIDGKTACEWAWRKVESWRKAFIQIGSGWVQADPRGFAQWLVDSCEKEPSEKLPRSDGPIEDRGDQLFFDSHMLDDAWRWILAEAPDAALIVAKRVKVNTYRGEGWDWKGLVEEEVDSVDQIRSGLASIAPAEELDIRKRHYSTDFVARLWLEQWRELDPAGFAASDYANSIAASPGSIREEWRSRQPGSPRVAANEMLESADSRDRALWIRTIADEWTTDDLPSALGWISSLDPAEQQSGLVSAFDAWHRKYGGLEPDWTEEPSGLRAAWEDLAILRSVAPRPSNPSESAEIGVPAGMSVEVP